MIRGGGLSSLFPFVRAFYGGSSPLFFRASDLAGGEEVVELASSTGTRQGDPLGGVLFALGHQQAL